ncbi:lactate dehydrogenase [Prosthecomicrobium hirschii]|uniref:Lactate dehydrogenase n=1 Tax=Prosthecodimorpha hirschii TaxID=665126 RepID=A0A0N8GEH7_9HYPH|nr:Ldh family oxidoreductase [Prosthecomicrobium hirschii]KPL51553.1 lactate dehydrogenase [Prosthecomicrobium hirschii]
MRIAIDAADRLVLAAFRRAGYPADAARTIADQIVGCELRGVGFAGLSRALSLIERTTEPPQPERIRIVRETPVSALIDGGDQNGYLVAPFAVRTGIAKAQANGLAAVGANNTWYSGMYAHYLEMATQAGLVAMAAGSSAPRVAPHGATEGRFGTNPIAFAFPSDDQPIIFDAGTSVMMIAELVLAERLGRPLPPGMAFDSAGVATEDPVAALAGAVRVWGGHKGSGIALVVQLLGMMVGGGALPADYRDCGFFFLAIDPGLFGDAADFRRRVSDYAAAVRTARPERPDQPVRMPFDRSAEARARIEAAGWFEVDDAIVARLAAAAGEPVPAPAGV